MKKHFFTLMPKALLLCALFAATSCQEDEETSVSNEEVESAEVNALMEEEYSSVSAFVEDATQAEPVQGGRVATTAESLPSCATISYVGQTKTLTIDFGTTNCTCRDGLERRGKIIAVFSGTRGEVGSKSTITLENYFVNNVQFTGSMVRTYQGNHTVSVAVRNASMITDEGTATWSSDRTVQQIAGMDTRTIFDDVWTVSGNYTGVNRRGVAYTTVIEQPLKKVLAIGCARNFVSGVISITNENGGNLKLNYDPTGKEPCDNIAEITINGRSKLISLR
ncbi:hypothetical protein [Pontibacter oryzae]|uniref:Lipoprotein n=1 Tax=Pontibacter oryzae TaxID=2304593 RepID=A0A399S871_9BACT|nr:hypothetical protein [Pontibacter oryzae]RIJ37785.1 hypothetical protein D1627_11880 [Pontibacter oryzae]